MPVVDDEDRLVGVISRRDFKKVRKSKQMLSPVKAIMSRDLITIPHDKSAIEAARLMIKHDIGRIPVMKEEKIIGIITRSDAMLYFYDLLPVKTGQLHRVHGAEAVLFALTCGFNHLFVLPPP